LLLHLVLYKFKLECYRLLQRDSHAGNTLCDLHRTFHLWNLGMEEESKMNNTILISVNTIPDRDREIKSLYKSLTAKKDKRFTIQQDRVNRIKIFHNKGSLRILVSTYIVVVLPVLLDFSPLDSIEGTVDFQLENTIDRLVKLTGRLCSLQGKKVIKGTAGAEGLRKALTSIF